MRSTRVNGGSVSRFCCAKITMSRIGIRVTVNLMPFPIYISRTTSFDSSFYLMGWAAPTFDALFTLQALVRSRVEGTADGSWNCGGSLTAGAR